MITIDTLRADHLGCYGYPRDTSDFIDGLARRGTVFNHAIAASASTGPSHASILTGLDPIVHGVRANGMPLRREAPTLAELVSRSGYTALAVVSSQGQFRPSELDRGFAVFRDPADLGEPQRHEMRAGDTVDMAIAELARVPLEIPVFLWIHFFDPHNPYDPPRLISAETPAQAADHVRFLQSRQGVQLDLFEDSPARLLRIVDAYDGEIRAVDEALRRFFRALEDRAGVRSATWFVTSDHGEGLGSHGWLLHGKNVYQEQVHVPLIVGSSDHRVVPQRLDGLVEHVDIFSTVLDLVGSLTPVDHQRSRAASFAAALAGGEFEGKKFAISERRSFDADEHRATIDALSRPKARFPRLLQPHRLPVDERDFFARLMRRQLIDNYESGESIAIQTLSRKLIHRTDHPDELFDLTVDPLETTGITGGESAPADDLRSAADLYLAVNPQGGTTDVPTIDPETREQLKALGYFD